MITSRRFQIRSSILLKLREVSCARIFGSQRYSLKWFLTSLGEAFSSLTLWSPPRGSFMYHERSLIGWLYFVFLASHERVPYFLMSARQACDAYIPRRVVLLYAVRMVFPYLRWDRLHPIPVALLHPFILEMLPLEMCYLSCKVCLLPSVRLAMWSVSLS